MASLQEMLKWLEQFMHGNLNAQHAPHMPTGATSAGAMPHPSMPSAGGMPSMGMPPGGEPGAPGAAGAAGAASAMGLPPGLANASPEELHQVMEQFSQLHPELAPYLDLNDATNLQSVVSQLEAIPPQALQGFTPTTFQPAEASSNDFDLGAPMSSEFGVPGFDAEDVTNFSSFAGGLGSEGSNGYSDLPSVLLDPTAGEFGPLPTSVGAGVGDDYDALAGALSGDAGTDYTDLFATGSPGFESDLPTFEPQFDNFDTPIDNSADSFDSFPQFEHQPTDEPVQHDFTPVEDYQDQ